MDELLNKNKGWSRRKEVPDTRLLCENFSLAKDKSAHPSTGGSGRTDELDYYQPVFESSRLYLISAMKNFFGINIFALFWRACSLYMLSAFLVTANSYADNQEPAITVIAFPSTSENTISRSSLRAIFGMRLSKWPADTQVKVFVMQDDAPEHGAFSKNILQVFPHQLRLAWDRQVFSGLGQYPEQVVSSQEMLSKIASTPGAIGYIKTSEVTNNVRILQIR